VFWWTGGSPDSVSGGPGVVGGGYWAAWVGIRVWCVWMREKIVLVWAGLAFYTTSV